AGVPALFVVPTLALAAAYVAAITAAGGNATRYIARQSPDAVADDAALLPWLCHKLEAVRQAGEANHRPGQSLCRECPHGRKSEYECGVPEREQRALKWFKVHGIDPWDYAPCHFLYDGLPSVKSAEILVAPAAAFSEALAFHNGVDEHGRFQRTQRLVIVDEAISPGKLVRAGLGNVEAWLTRLAAIQKRAHEEIARWHGLPSAAGEIA
ncbi:membrane or secreted protein, partial [mine drainage metagenome]